MLCQSMHILQYLHRRNKGITQSYFPILRLVLHRVMAMAQDVLCLTLYDMEEKGEPIPEPSDPRRLRFDKTSFVTLVCCDTLEYRKFFDNKAVKKTLTVPHWLDEMAIRANINFSQTLQNGLMEQLGVKR